MRSTLVLVVALAIAGCLPPPSTNAPRTTAPAARLEPANPVVDAYLSTLVDWMTPEEIAALANVDLHDTARGDIQRLRYLAADRVVRRLLPLTLRQQHHPSLDVLAERLEHLPPLLNEDTDLVAAPTVRASLRALRAHASGRPLPDAMPLSHPPRLPGAAPDGGAEGPTPRLLTELDGSEAFDAVAAEATDPEAEAMFAEALAGYSETYARVHGLSAIEGDAVAAAVSDSVDTAFIFRHMVDAYGLPRRLAVDEATQLLSDMADAARRRERLPRLRRVDQAPTDTRPAGRP